MARRRKGRAIKKLGMKPGAVVYIGKERDHDIVIDVIDYTETHLSEHIIGCVEETFPFRDSKTISWLNFDGIYNTEFIEKVGTHFNVHPLLLEDLVNTGHRPSFAEGPEYLFIVLKMLRHDETSHGIVSEQVSIVCGRNIVMSFQEVPGDVFDGVRSRLTDTIPRGRFMQTDYLAYSLMDAVVDHYFVVLEHLGEQIETIEEQLMENPRPEHPAAIRNIKREMMSVRRAAWPLREILAGLERSESKLIHSETRPYLRDLYEHVIHVIDNVELYRETISSLQDIYLSGLSNRMNEIMKVLTMIATIFIPLGFLASVYGMNFDTGAGRLNMPELGWPFGYVAFWGVVVIVALGLVLFFRRKKWL